MGFVGELFGELGNVIILEALLFTIRWVAPSLAQAHHFLFFDPLLFFFFLFLTISKRIVFFVLHKTVQGKLYKCMIVLYVFFLNFADR